MATHSSGVNGNYWQGSGYTDRRYKVYMSYSYEDPDIVNNRTKISSIALQIENTYSMGVWSNQGEGSALIKINGSTIKSSSNMNYSLDERQNVWVTMISITSNDNIYVNHNDDGTMTIEIYAEFNSGQNLSLTKAWATASDVVLPTIPRASDINAVPNFNFEDGTVVSVTKKAADIATDYITLKIGDNVIGNATILPDETSSTISFTSTGLADIYSLIASNTKTATVTVESLTKFGDDTVGTDSTTTTGTIAGTARVKVSGTWKKAIPWVKINGVWTRAVANYKDGSTWRRGQ